MAFTVNVTASIIDVTAGTGDFGDLYTAAIAHTAGCMTNPSGTVYQVEGNREVELSSGVVLTSTENETIQWNLSAAKYPIFEVAAGATLNLTQNTTIIGDINNTYYSYIYFGGTVHINGTLGNEVIIEKMRSVYWYMYDTTPWDWDYVILRDNTYSTGYFIYCSPYLRSNYDGSRVAHNFNKVTIMDSRGYGYPYFDRGDYSNMIFTNWLVQDTEEMIMYTVSGIKFTNCEFKGSDDYIRHYGNGYGMEISRVHSSKTMDFGAQGRNQNMEVFDTCTIDDMDNGVWGILAYGGCSILLKDCTIKNQTYAIGACDTNIRLYGSLTFDTVGTEKIWSGGGTYLHSRKFNITVQDSGGSPIENATVRVRTKLEKTVGSRDYPYEEYSFLTNENGRYVGAVEDDLYLTEKEEYSAGNYYQWSDGNSNNVHIIEVSKTGYTLDTREIAMTEDRDITVTLTDNDATTKLIDSTIIDSTIY